MSDHLPQDPICLELYGPHDPRFRSCAGCNAYRRVREDERAHILALSERVKESQYAAALRDAVEAVAALGDRFISTDDITIPAALAAIDTLREKP